MYKGQKLSLKTFKSNHSFEFIEDEETILRLTKALLDMPFCKAYHSVWIQPDFTPGTYPDEIYREDGLLPEECSACIDTLSYAESLTLLRADLELPERRKQLETDGLIDTLLKVYVSLYVGYLKNDCHK